MPLPSELSEVKHAKNSTVYLQDACLQHRYIRSRDTSAIVERPERLRAVKLGLAAAISRIEDLDPQVHHHTSNVRVKTETPHESDTDALVAALDLINLGPDAVVTIDTKIAIIESAASVDILHHPAVKFVHGDIDGDVYLENLVEWATSSHDKIAKGDSEIPPDLPQADLYLSTGSIDAIQGALGTVCEAVGNVLSSTHGPAFVAIRPPGHHCGEDSPSGFCFVNNVAVGAAHAHLKHGINRVVILDIDLHHGNGTQSIVWQINEETYRKTLEGDAGASTSKTGLQIYYGSLHDILSFPCEDGKVELVQAASASLHGPHGQWIENVHLEPYESEQHFWEDLYPNKYSQILKRAEEFISSTGGEGEDILFFISCGFDACEHEYQSMSRHNRKVPASFYCRFAQDARNLADRLAHGRLISVLEGGYSDRALSSGAMAHLSGLAISPEMGAQVDEAWWNLENLEKLEKAARKRKGPRQSLPSTDASDSWLERTLTIFHSMERNVAKYMATTSTYGTPLQPPSMTLRERKKPESSPTPSPTGKRTKAGAGGREMDSAKGGRTQRGIALSSGVLPSNTNLAGTAAPSSTPEQTAVRKLPRVILHVRPPQE